VVDPIRIGVIIGLLAIIAIGFYVSKFVKGKALNYLLAGRALPIWWGAAALMGQGIDANVTLGNIENVFYTGFWSGLVLPLGLGITLFLTGMFFAEKLNRMKLLTLIDFFRRVYDRKIEVLTSWITIFAYGILLAGNLAAVALLAQSLFGIPYVLGLIIIAALIFSYTFLGGLISDTVMDIFYVSLVAIGGILSVVFFELKYGILNVLQFDPAITTSLGYSLTQFTNISHGALINWATIFALGLGDIVAIDFIARVLAAKTPKIAKKSCLWASLGYVIVGLLFSLTGIIAINVFRIEGFIPGANPVIFDLLFNFTPILVAVFILIAIIGSSMAFSDGAMLQTSAVITHNLMGIQLGERVKKGFLAKRERLLISTRLTLLPVIILGILTAILLPAPGALLALTFDIIFASAFVPFVLGFYWKKANTTAAWWAIWIGMISRILFFVLTPTIYGKQNTILYIQNTIFTSTWDGFGTLIAPVIALVVYIIITLLNKEKRTISSSASS